MSNSGAVAVIGMSCRFPGIEGVSELWDFLSRPGRAADALAGFEDDSVSFGDFDANLFGISPVEARALDPKQRLALELTWAAFEHAGIAVLAPPENAVGVYFAASGDDYLRGREESGNPYLLVGGERAAIANRISHTFGFTGPSMLVDSGQSSSLVALHTAVDGVRRGAYELVVVGGVHVGFSGRRRRLLDAAGILSASGRCSAFDARADGLVPGVGGGVVLLRRYESARRDGNTVHAVVRGGAVSNDGRTFGFGAPSSSAQSALIRSAHADAGVASSDISFVELHGTGTKAGDAAEAAALAAAFGDRAATKPLLVGSVKPDIGHLEAAAGVSGFIKTVLSLSHRKVLPSRNFSAPPPEIDLSAAGIEVTEELSDLAEEGSDAAVYAGVSSYGFGGTNCHMVVSTAPPAEIPAAVGDAEDRATVWVISGRGEAALRAQARRLHTRVLDRAELTAGDVAHSLATARSTLENRMVIVGAERESLISRLAAAMAGDIAPGVAVGRAAVPGGRSAWLLPGQGSQRLRMGSRLAQCFPAFELAMAEVCGQLDRHLEHRVREVLNADHPALLEQVQYTQVAMFAIEVALCRMLESWSVRPDFLLGHSAGSYAAAHIAGVLDLTDAARLVAARGHLLMAAPDGGAMVALDVGETAVAESLQRLSDWQQRLSIAAINSSTSVVISGDEDAVAEVAEYWVDRGHRAKRLNTAKAGHSPHVEGLRDELHAVLAGIELREPRIPIISDSTGQLLTAAEATSPRYWADHLRRPIRFADAIACLDELGVRRYLEVGPGAGLSALAHVGAGGDAVVVPLLPAGRAENAEDQAVLEALGELFVAGEPIDWSAITRTAGVRRVDLPTYAFQRRRYWLAEDADTPGAIPDPRSLPEIDPGSTAIADTAPVSDGHSVLRKVCTAVAVTLEYEDPDAVDPDRTFEDLGFDSRSAVALSRKLRTVAGRPLPATLVFEYPTPRAVAEFLQSGGPGPVRANPVVVEAPGSGTDPVVIVGMGCRLPGGIASPDALWQFVSEGRDAIGEFPRDRGWELAGLFDPDPGAMGKTYARTGGFLDDAGAFDAELFGISPREAMAMDPHQRLLLETAWAGLEHAGLAPDSLRGTDTGIFVGIYGAGIYGADAGPESEGFRLTGNAASVASGRLAYLLGSEGPALSIDTACSSGLVALHQAVRSLRWGECELALVGGVTVLTTPEIFVEFSRQRGLAPDGRCKSFAAGADGVGWAEGAGVLVVERLSRARRLGHGVLAVIRGSAVNQDGASNGLTAPSGPAQRRVVMGALADAGLSAADVDAVEAHGTGTTLGDPIEAEALLATYGQDRPDGRPLRLGSVKSNLGHTQAAAGIVGVIKMVQAMRYNTLPKTLHIDAPSQMVDWSSGAVELLAEHREWPNDPARIRRAGVSSFGISGTNAHVILEEAPAVTVRPTAGDRSRAEHTTAWVLSARNRKALTEQACHLSEHLSAQPEWDPVDVGWSLATGRARLNHRAVILGANRAELTAGTSALAEDTEDAGLIEGVAGTGDGTTAIVFPGQGAQMTGMGRQLYHEFPVFAAAFDAVTGELDELLDTSVREVLWDGESERVHDTLFAQAGLFAVGVALFRLLESWGVRPDLVMGHSIGEIAAAHVSGILPLRDAAELVAARGRLMAALPEGGAMAAVAAGESRVRALLVDGVDIAVVNSPDTVVISGAVAAVEKTSAVLAGSGYRVTPLRVSHAFHSSLMEPMLDGFARAVADLPFAQPRLPLVSNLDGSVNGSSMASPGYWVRHVRETVRFADGIAAAAASGARRFVIAGPDGGLSSLIEHTLTEAGIVGDRTVVPLLRRDREESTTVLAAAARLFVSGLDVRWPALFEDREAQRVPLPGYAFQHRHYWLNSTATVRDSLFSLEWSPHRGEVTADPDAHTASWDRFTGEPVVVFDSRTAFGAGSDPVGRARRGLREMLTVLQEFVSDTRFAASTLLIVTERAVAVTAEDVADPAAAALWGMARSAQSEDPGRIVLVDIDTPGAVDIGPVLAAGEPQVVVRGGTRYRGRLTRVPAPPSSGPDLTAGTVVITGGTGGLGAVLARHLVSRYDVRSLLLASRSGPTAPGAAELCADLTNAGAAVRVVACDLSDPDGVTRLLAQVLADQPLIGVVHAAGVLDAGVIGSLTPRRVETALAAKADAAWRLHEATAGSDLAIFVLCSSLIATLGLPGHASYAAANGFLDGLAAQRRSRGQPATSIAWGLWADGTGMAARRDAAWVTRLGLSEMPIELGLALFDAAVTLDHPDVVAAPMDPAALAARYRAGPVPTILRELVPGTPAAAAAATPLLPDRLRGLSPDRARTLVLDLVRRDLAYVLGHTDAAAIEPNRNFRDAGVDSLTAVEARNRLCATTGMDLPISLVFDYPTPEAAADFLISQATALTEPDSDPPSDDAIRVVLRDIPIERLRAAGLLDALLDVAGAHRSGEPAYTPDESVSIAELDADELIDLALRSVQQRGDLRPTPSTE